MSRPKSSWGEIFGAIGAISVVTVPSEQQASFAISERHRSRHSVRFRLRWPGNDNDAKPMIAIGTIANVPNCPADADKQPRQSYSWRFNQICSVVRGSSQ